MQRLRPQLRKQPSHITIYRQTDRDAKVKPHLAAVPAASPAHPGVSRQVRRHMEREFAK